MTWGFNLRTTMVDKDPVIAESQNLQLFNAGGRSIYYADLDEEFDWFGAEGHNLTVRLYKWWVSKGAEVLHPLINSNVGVETSVPQSIWDKFLTARNGWATMARKDLIAAIIRTKHAGGWNWLLNDLRRQKAAFSGIPMKGVIGPDTFLFYTDAWSNPSPTSWNRLTPEGIQMVQLLGRIAYGNPFLDFVRDARRIWSTVISDACFVYDHGNGPRVESMFGNITPNIIEFGVSKNCANRETALSNLFQYIKSRTVTRALLHTPIDPSLAWYWKTSGGTTPLWDTTGYATTGGNHEYTVWPYTTLRQIITVNMKPTGS